MFTLQTVIKFDVTRHVTILRGWSAPGLDGVSGSTLKDYVSNFFQIIPISYLLKFKTWNIPEQI